MMGGSILRVGLTGLIGSGKSYVSREFESAGAVVYNSDARAIEIIARDETVRESIKSLLGRESFDAAGRYDRQWVSRQVFSDATLLGRLNTIVHPAVCRDFLEWAALQERARFVLLESALLPRLDYKSWVDRVIVVVAPPEVSISRVMARDGVTRAQALARLNSQASLDSYLSIADYVIHNDGGDRSTLIAQVDSIARELDSFN